jgi:hypothetical protein
VTRDQLSALAEESSRWRRVPSTFITTFLGRVLRSSGRVPTEGKCGPDSPSHTRHSCSVPRTAMEDAGGTR